MFDLPLKQRKRHILHIDADAFFASVEQILNPKLRGKPVLVGFSRSSNNGIVSAASYEARPFGIHSGMAMFLAKKKCPGAIVVAGHFDAYRDFSKRMYEIFTRSTAEIEMASIDEAYLDITGYAERFNETPELYARNLLFEVYQKLGLSVSCGLASSKTVAKVASSQNKPHKLTVVPYGKEAGFLAPLGLRAMPGIGPKTFSVLERYGLKSIGELACLTIEEVMEKFGVHGIPLWKRARGIDNNPVISDSALPKSISKEHTFYQPPANLDVCLGQMKELGEIVFGKLRSHQLKARTVFVKIRYYSGEGGRKNFRDFGFQRNLDFPSCIDSKLFPAIKKLFLENVENIGEIRLVGLGVSGLYQNYNLSLFENEDEDEKLFLKMDMLKKLYGDKALRYGA